jgi:outer membrane protein
MRFPNKLLICASVLLSAQTFANELPKQIGIAEIIPMALDNYFSIRVAEIETDRAEAAIDASARQFETNISGSISRGQDNGTTSIDEPTTDVPGRPYFTSQSYSINREFTTGTSASIGVNSTDFDIQPEVSSTVASVEINQNLLRGRGFNFNRAPIRIATKQFEISKESLRQTVIDTVAEAQFAYFDGVLAEENLGVAQESLELAQTLLKENKKRAEAGSIATSDLLQTEAEVARREEQVYRAESTLVAAQNRLKRLLSQKTVDLLDWDFKFVTPRAPVYEAFEVLQAYDVALQLRPDYRQSTYGLEIGEIEELRERNSMLPDVDLYARMTLLAQGASFNDSLKNTLDVEQPGYAIGVRFSKSLFNQARKADLIRAKLATNQLQLTLRQLEQSILLDIDATIARIEANWSRHQTAEAGKLLAEKSLEAEEKRYQRGTSSTFVLIRLQSDLNNARIRALVAANDYQKSIVELHRQTGKLLELHNITM